MGYYSATKKEGNLVRPGMDLEGIMLSKISLTEKDKYTKTKHKNQTQTLTYRGPTTWLPEARVRRWAKWASKLKGTNKNLQS